MFWSLPLYRTTPPTNGLPPPPFLVSTLAIALGSKLWFRWHNSQLVGRLGGEAAMADFHLHQSQLSGGLLRSARVRTLPPEKAQNCSGSSSSASLTLVMEMEARKWRCQVALSSPSPSMCGARNQTTVIRIGLFDSIPLIFFFFLLYTTKLIGFLFLFGP